MWRTGAGRAGLAAGVIAAGIALAPVAAAAPPAPPDSLTATTVNNVQHTITVAWPNDSGEHVVVEAKADSEPVDENDGTRVYDGTGSTVTVSDPLVDQTLYWFRVFSTDGTTYTAGAANYAYTPPPPATVQSVETVMNRNDAIHLRIAYTRGCDYAEDCQEVRAQYDVGADSPYPTSIFAPFPHQSQELYRHPDEINVGPNERRVLHVSVWQVGASNVLSTPVHLEVRTGRWLEGLRPITSASPIGTSAHRARLRFRAHSRRLRGYVVYGARGWHAPGRPNHPPATKPLLRCSAAECASPGFYDTNTRVIRHLPDTRPYAFRVYGYDKAGHYRGNRATVIPHRRGLSIGGRAWWHLENARTRSVVRDKTGTYHAVVWSSYIARRPGGSWRQANFHRFWAGAESLSPDGSKVFVAFRDNPDHQNYLHIAAVRAGSTAWPHGSSANATPYFVGDYPGEDEGAPPPGPVYAPVGLQSMTGGRVAILMNRYDNHTLVVATGRPGGAFTESTLTPGSVRPEETFMTRDPATDQLVIVARAVVAGADGFYSWSTSGTNSATWLGPKPLPYRTGDHLSSIAADGGRMWAGMTRNASSATTGFGPPFWGAHAATDGAFVIEGRQSGGWGKPVRLPHSSRFAELPVLATRDGSVRALYVEARPGAPLTNAGLRLTNKVDGTWSRPTRLSRFWRDVPVALIARPTSGFTYAFDRH